MRKNPFKKLGLSTEYKNLISQINILADNLNTLNESELRAKIRELQERYRKDQNLKSLIAESFALTREASTRAVGMKHFDVQIIGGLVLNDQKIAEMKTGEGKTLVATLPACLNALTKKGVHVITVNNYLANRDQISMGQVYKTLGFDTGLIQDRLSRSERQKNYNADITYVTNYELAFDFLKDNMTFESTNIVLRPFNYCIIDEIDSVLIDEAQTPLILSDRVETPIEKYLVAAEVTDYLKSTLHYNVDEKNKNIILTDQGSKQIEEILGIQDLYNPNDPWIPYIINALKARALFFTNIHYVVQNDQIVIVDEFTGRIMPDRRWGDGLHQAIEAKEKVQIQEKTETAAAITYQNFFLLYPKLSGMTGTGKTAEAEFEKIYNLRVNEIPTAQPIKRKDLSDFIYKDQFLKWEAVAQTCCEIAVTDQPILIGTTTIEKSEMLAQLLGEYKLAYRLLNARPENVRKESEIVAQAGKKQAITIATNMAGRGTDIILGGNISFGIQKKLYSILTLTKSYAFVHKTNFWKNKFRSELQYNSQKFLSVLFSLLTDQTFTRFSDIDILRALKENERRSSVKASYQQSIQFLILELEKQHKKHQIQENQIVKNLGGLYIIGTERNDSRRIDNQLRGRCGRQGDPGTSRFFLSLDDNLLRLFGGSQIQNFMRTQMIDNTPLESKILTKSLDSAQSRVEERSYQQRKNVFDYDDVLNKQRNIVYLERTQILNSVSAQNAILVYGEQFILDVLKVLSTANFALTDIFIYVGMIFGTNVTLKYYDNFESVINLSSFAELKFYLFNEFWLTYYARNAKLEVYGKDVVESFEQTIILTNIDRVWREHLQKMNFLREAVGWRGYGQRNPLFEYKKDAFFTFEKCKKTLRQLIIYNLFRADIL